MVSVARAVSQGAAQGVDYFPQQNLPAGVAPFSQKLSVAAHVLRADRFGSLGNAPGLEGNNQSDRRGENNSLSPLPCDRGHVIPLWPSVSTSVKTMKMTQISEI